MTVLAAEVGALVRPLAIGTHKRLRELRRDDVEPGAVVSRLKDYTRQPAYRLALSRKGAMRHDPWGNVVEPVAEAHRAYADEWLAERRQRIEARRAAEAEAARLAEIAASVARGAAANRARPTLTLKLRKSA